MVEVREKTFTYPPMHLTLELCLDFHREQNASHPAFIYSNPDGDTIQSCTYEEFVPAVHRAGRVLSERLECHPDGCSSTPLVVGLLVQADSLTYITTLAGLMRVGITAFPISYRFSSTIIAHLLDKSRPAAIIVDPTTELLAIEAINTYVGLSQARPILVQLPTLASLYPGHNVYHPLPRSFRKPDDPSILIHSSSSSSGFPNIVPWSSLAVSHHGEVEEMPIQHLTGKILRGCGLELFHSLALCLFFMMIRKGLVLSFSNPWIHTTNTNDFTEFFRSIKLIKPSFIVTNARVIEAWAESSTQINILRMCGANIFYGGSFMSKIMGTKLVKNGVRICTAYGSTESGPISILPHFRGEDWEYFTVKPRSDVIFIPRQDGLFEIVVSPTNDNSSYLAVFNTTWDGRLAYNPGDLFIAHPSTPNTYKMFGRLGDQILLTSGETINPIELEAELTKNPIVANAVMFGHRRPMVGIIVEPSRSLTDFVNAEHYGRCVLDIIWPAVVQAHLKVLSYPRISKNMIIVADEGKPFPVSLKGAPIRASVWQLYQEEMNALYRK